MAGRLNGCPGFVEIGESVEDAVRREVAEETGVSLVTVEYAASQAWPFPAGLMAGFRATAAGESGTADGREILETRWFIVYGTGDIFFRRKWAYWLRDAIPGATGIVEIDGGRLFFPDERATELTAALRRHWDSHP